MRYALFGDIHGNLEALQAVVDDFLHKGVDEVICLGDIVGYGANPEECVQIVRKLGCLTVVGNHDHAAIGHLDVSCFNPYARTAAFWTGKHLSHESKEWLCSLSFIEYCDAFTLVHGSLPSPELFNYIQTIRHAEFTFRLMDKHLCFCGHSHVPLAFFNTDPIYYTIDEIIDIDPAVKTIVNIGSVGQPRDERPQAAYAIYDTTKAEVRICRVDYDIAAAAKKITEAGLPQPLASRLWLGK
ncbi:MAG: metallophosphoesterase family protein [Planctomycetes bacterium]|nr:metallophosphoesterase family protein [Planctomycetota bacterium]